jgi:hypothetical protein
LKKTLLFFVLLQSLLFGQGEVLEKVKNLIDIESYQRHYNLISQLFRDERRFIRNDKIEVVLILKKLKEEGIMNFQLEKPETIRLSFHGIGNPIFIMKIASDSLQESGYFKYRISKVARNDNNLSLFVEFPSQTIPDPTILTDSLQKGGAEIIDISRDGNLSWNYLINISKGLINSIALDWGEEKSIQRPTEDIWIKLQKEGILEFRSRGNNWHPEIFFYDENLELIKVFKKNVKRIKLRLKISEDVRYVKVSDIYYLHNLKNGLTLSFEEIIRR